MPHPKGSLKHKLHEIIFEADTPKGKLFDVVILFLIILSVVVVMLETVPSIEAIHDRTFRGLEWILTILFTVEYGLRIYSVKRPYKYINSFYGIIDLLAILPTYLSIFLPGSQILATVRAMRLLRVFKVLEMSSFTRQSKIIMLAMRSSMVKISVFVFFIVIMVTIFGTIIYFVEHDANEDIVSIPGSVWFAIVTLSTVGYGDIVPVTTIGKFLSSILMILGYGVIAVPTGIVTSEFISSSSTPSSTQACETCSREGHDADAVHCKFCGDQLNDD
ncbi:MAG: ion transporter [Saprospiraceae bacterium]|nr:ion transporter [Saprospiraceae bacterium]|tara:strand:- start:317 stop:1141 length:825 start_codon:yes stop_codon:yes gene_type:complete